MTNRVNNSHPCAADCTCARHPGGKRSTSVCANCGVVFELPRSMVDKRKFCSPECHLQDYWSNEERQRSKSENVQAGHARRSPEARALHGKRISEARTGMRFSDEHKTRIAETAEHNWSGGVTGDAFAEVLQPAGFIREYHFHYGDRVVQTAYGLRRRSFNLDFAHVEGKVNIELDGTSHKSSAEADASRDAILRANGWRVIRIKHA